MVRFKPLLPTVKEKKRYILYRIHTTKSLSANTGHLLTDELNTVLGLFDAAQAGLMPIFFDSRKGLGVLKTATPLLDKSRLAMMMITSMNQEKVMVQPLLTSGSLRKVKEAIVR